MKQPLISVIVPVYNVEKFLDRCVQSIVDQTYSHLEIILVDDGSPDNCPAMCDAWAAKDSRIRVIHKANGGGAQARNAGLDTARGDYIAFVDSDDYVFSTIYDKLLKTLIESHSDIAECGFTEVDSDVYPSARASEKTVQLLGTEDALQENIKDKICRQLVWNKLYRADVIGKIRFVEGKFIDDEFFTYRVLGNAAQVAVISEKLYCYRQQAGSAMHQFYSLKRLDALEAKLARAQYMDAHFPRLAHAAYTNLWGSCIYAGQMLLRYCGDDVAASGMAAIKAVLRTCPIRLKAVLGTNVNQFIWLMMAKMSLILTCRIRNKLGIGF